jgi:hypothetical protein
MLLDAKPGGGVWEIMKGVAVSCDWDKMAAADRYRSHHVMCRKNPRNKVSDEPIPE